MNWDKTNGHIRNRVVAILAGWEMGPSEDLPCGPFRITAMTKWHKKSDGPGYGWVDEPPNLLEDLDAMHEAEEGLSDASYDAYCTHLWNICGGASGKTGAIRATAEQRAKALWLALRDTPIGKEADGFANVLIKRYREGREIMAAEKPSRLGKKTF